MFCNDITPLKDAERQLKATNEELVAEHNRLASLTTALDNMDDLVIITNPFGAISYVNKAFETKTGFVLTDVEGKNIRELAAPKNRFALSQDAFMTDQKTTWNGNFIALNKYGLSLPFLLRSSPVFEENRLKNRVFVLREEMFTKR